METLQEFLDNFVLDDSNDKTMHMKIVFESDNGDQFEAQEVEFHYLNNEIVVKIRELA